MRRRMAVLTGLAALLLAAAGCSGAAGADEKLVGIRLAGPFTAGAGATPQATGPIGYALHLKLAQPILRKAGYRYVGFAGFNNGPPAAQALAGGSVQLAAIGDAPAVLSRAAGQPNRALVISAAPGGTWIAARKHGPTSLTGLRGKKIGVQFGSNMDHYLRQALGDAGVGTDVHLVNLVTAAGLPALIKGDIDAYAAPSASVAVWQKQGFPVLDRAEKSHPNYLAGNITLVNSAFLRQHPTIQAAWWAATKAGLAAIRKDPGAYYTWLAGVQRQPVDVIRDTTVLTYPTQPVPAAAIASVTGTKTFLLGQKLARKDFDVSAWAVSGARAGS